MNMHVYIKQLQFIFSRVSPQSSQVSQGGAADARPTATLVNLQFRLLVFFFKQQFIFSRVSHTFHEQAKEEPQRRDRRRRNAVLCKLLIAYLSMSMFYVNN